MNRLLLTPLRVLGRGLALSLVLFALAFTGSSFAAQPPQYFVDESKLPFEPRPGAQAYWGVLAGAGYQIEVPDNWNGSLVVWAHGFRGTGLELTVDKHPLRDVLIPNGYAWAASSYDRNDYDIASGVKSTHTLIKRFNGIVGKPSQVLISGFSLGGPLPAVLIAPYPGLFDGALPMCGVMADYELFDYFLDFNLAAQQIGVGGGTFPVDPVNYLFGTVPVIKANLEAIPGGWPVILNTDGNNFKNLVEIVSGGDRPNFDEAWFFWNTFPDNGSGPGNFLFDLALGDGSLPRAPGSAPDNVDTVYQFDADPALTPAEQELNDLILRVEGAPQTRRKQGLAQVPTVSGDIAMPVLTLHNLGDLFVPVLNQVEYAKRVLAQGNSERLVQRAIRGVGHCGFTADELTTAFFDLVNWVDNGVKPAGDNFLDPAAVADPDFGCQFSDDSGHLLATPCP